VIEMASIMVGVAGVAQQLKTANATTAAPSGLRIMDFNPDTASGNTDAVDIQEQDTGISSPFNHDGSSFSSGAYQVNVNIGTLNSAYSGSATQATLEFGGFLDSSTMTSSALADCTFAWDVIVGENNSLTGTGVAASITGTASTNQNSLNISSGDGVGEKAVLTFGGGKSLTFPAVNDVFHINVSCTATNAGGSASASVNIEYTFVL